MSDQELIRQAAQALAGADALVIGAGAGMGVDSGLPDFRGEHGFWRAYPPYAKLGLGFSAVANPRWFVSDPELAWGFYGHRLHLYRATRPHDGFGILLSWARRTKHGGFVFTSNVDGHFQRAGFDTERVVEVHGAIDWMQCLGGCGIGLFPAEGCEVTVDASTMRARPPLPACPGCGGLARPNILMFNDVGWDDTRTSAQAVRLNAWLKVVGPARLIIIECGAGTAIPTVRDTSEALAVSPNVTLVRINPGEPSAPAGHIGLGLGAREALQAIDRKIGEAW